MPLRRRTPFRMKRRIPRQRVVRPAMLPPLPRDWSARCLVVRRRDLRCRWCGGDIPVGDAQINHIIPRRVADAAWRDEPWNLVLLDAGHHAEFTHGPEAALFRGDPYEWFKWLAVFRQSGPAPAADHIGTALERLRELLAVQRAVNEEAR